MRSGGYFLATLIQTGTSFIVIALLSRLLTPDEFGRWALYEPAVLLGAQLILLGGSSGILKIIAGDRLPLQHAVSGVIRYAFWIIIFFSVLTGYLASLFLAGDLWGSALGCWVLTESILVLLLSAFRGANQPSFFLISAVVRASLILCGLTIAIWIKGNHLVRAEYIAMWWAIASGTSALVLIYAMSCMNKSGWSQENGTPRTTYFAAISYGFPILMATILAAVLSNADRYVLAANISQTEVGIYAVTVKIASSLNLLVTPLNLWWPTVRFRHLSDDDGGEAFFGRAIIQLITLFFAAGAGLWFVSPWLLQIMSPYANPEESIVVALIISAVAMAISVPFNVGALKEGKTKWNILIVGIPTSLQVLLTVMVAPKFGAVGVAWCTCLGSCLLLMLTIFISQKIHPVRWPVLDIIIAVGSILLISIIARLISSDVIIATTIYCVLLVVLILLRKKKYWPLIAD